MPEQSSQNYNRGHAPDDKTMTVELAINDRAEAIVFFSKPFPHDLSWLEFDLNNSRLDFIMDNGEIRTFGIPVQPELAKYMQNAFQVLMVLMDEKTGEPVGGNYFPLIIHRA